MISLAQPLPSGGAVRINFTPPEASWVVLRRLDDDFVGYPDPDAFVVDSGMGDMLTFDGLREVIDYQGLLNGTPYFYQLYIDTGTDWEPYSDVVTATPEYEVQSNFQIPEPVELVRERLELGIASEVALGNLNHPQGYVPVLRSPPILDNTTFPCITVLLESRAAEVRGVGELVLPDRYDEANDVWEEYQGWLDRSTIQITAWSLNAQERADLRRVIQSLLIQNLPVFSEAGLTLIDVSTADNFDPQSYGVPVFQAVFQFSCQHPAIVIDHIPTIHHVESNTNGERPNPHQ